MSCRVLIVDDTLIMRQRIGAIAEKAGWEIAGLARDGVEAVELHRQHRPDLITLDIVMPKMDGVAALKAILAEDPHQRIVMVSAVNQKAKLAECISAGALDFIVKPFAAEDLERLFDKYRTTESGGPDA